MKRLKIRGITGMPLFIVRFHGRLDGKRNVVAFKDGKWEGHYLQKKEAIFHSFVHRTYRELEEKTSQLHKESVRQYEMTSTLVKRGFACHTLSANPK